MYIPPQFEQPDSETLHALIRNRPLATLITLNADGINANHIPLHFSKTPDCHQVILHCNLFEKHQKQKSPCT